MLNYPLLYVEHLSEGDLDLLTRTAESRSHGEPLELRLTEQPGMIDDLLAMPELFDTIFGGPDLDIGVRITPFLAFGVLVNRVFQDLTIASHVLEWAGPGRRLPVFDVRSLQDFLEDPARRYFLIELLASFTKVASGSMWVRTRKGYRRRRYSELDPVRLAEIVDSLPTTQRPAGYRRLGDVALFLSGVFPDHTAQHPFRPVEREHLAQSARLGAIAALDDSHLGFHEAAGAGWYRRAVDTAASVVGGGPDFLLDIADRIRQARRILNYLADDYLYRYDSGLMRPAS